MQKSKILEEFSLDSTNLSEIMHHFWHLPGQFYGYDKNSTGPNAVLVLSYLRNKIDNKHTIRDSHQSFMLFLDYTISYASRYAKSFVTLVANYEKLKDLEHTCAKDEQVWVQQQLIAVRNKFALILQNFQIAMSDRASGENCKATMNIPKESVGKSWWNYFGL